MLLIQLIVLATALSIFLSSANLFFRDVKYLVEAILTFAIFFTPVFYEASFAGRWEWLLLLNPVAPILEGLYACIVLHNPPQLFWITYSGIISLALLVAAGRAFHALEPRFAEII